jgi:hypothetical protein
MWGAGGGRKTKQHKNAELGISRLIHALIFAVRKFVNEGLVRFYTYAGRGSSLWNWPNVTSYNDTFKKKKKPSRNCIRNCTEGFV